jgi:hypothetical protein
VIREALAKEKPETIAGANEIAAKGLEDAVIGGTMTDADLARIEALATELAPKTQAQLREDLEKERLIYNIILLREARRKANLAALVPKDAGSFVSAFTEDSKASGPTLQPIQPPGSPGHHLNGNGQPPIEGEFTVVAPNPTTRAIEQFLAKENA